MSVVALSPKAINKIQAIAESRKSKHHGLVYILQKLSSSVSHDINCGVVKRAFAYWNLGYGKNVFNSMSIPSSSSSSIGVSPKMKVEASEQMTLLAICAAGVPDKTIGVLHSLEAAMEEHALCNEFKPMNSEGISGVSGTGGVYRNNGVSCSSPFHVLVGVSPFPGDYTAEYLSSSGIYVLKQPAPLGLSDLWNRIVKFAFRDNNYKHLILSNNDVLIPPGAVGGVNALLKLEPTKIATVASQQVFPLLCVFVLLLFFFSPLLSRC